MFFTLECCGKARKIWFQAGWIGCHRSSTGFFVAAEAALQRHLLGIARPACEIVAGARIRQHRLTKEEGINAGPLCTRSRSHPIATDTELDRDVEGASPMHFLSGYSMIGPEEKACPKFTIPSTLRPPFALWPSGIRCATPRPAPTGIDEAFRNLTRIRRLSYRDVLDTQ
jgi:hypothetical protein